MIGWLSVFEAIKVKKIKYCCQYCFYTEGDDYIKVSNSLLMESGFTAGACTPLILSVIKDGVLESDETFQLLTDASGPAIPSSSNGGTTRITIVDDDSTCEQHTYITLL